jgi:hypothetical protein
MALFFYDDDRKDAGFKTADRYEGCPRKSYHYKIPWTIL